MQLLFIGFQLAESHRPVGTNPVRRVIGLAGLQLFHAIHDDTIAAEQNIPLGNALGRQQQVLIVATEDHQQLDVRVARMVDHFDSRRFHRRMVAQEVRTLIVGREDDSITFRYLIEVDRELLAAPASLAAKPGGDNRRRLLLYDVRRGSKNHRQRQRTVVARVVERHREVGEIVTDLQRLIG